MERFGHVENLPRQVGLQKMQMSAFENARDEGSHNKFVLLNTPRGKGAGQGVDVADVARFAEAAREVRTRENQKNETR